MEKDFIKSSFCKICIIYLGYSDVVTPDFSDKEERERFKYALLHPDYGLSVYITMIDQVQYIVLRSSEVDLQVFLDEITSFGKDSQNRLDLDANTVEKLLNNEL